MSFNLDMSDSAKSSTPDQKEDHDLTHQVHSANSWETADLGDKQRNEKFLRLMGAAKKEHHGKIVIGDNSPGQKRQRKEVGHLEDDLVEQYEQSLEHRMASGKKGHLGLGYHSGQAEQVGEPEETVDAEETGEAEEVKKDLPDDGRDEDASKEEVQNEDSEKKEDEKSSDSSNSSSSSSSCSSEESKSEKDCNKADSSEPDVKKMKFIKGHS